MKMEIKEMKMEDIEARKAEIAKMLEQPEDLDIDALENEVNELEARANEIKEQAEKRNSLSTKIAIGQVGSVVEKEDNKETRKSMEIKELRKSPEYLDAWVEAQKGNDKEMRTLMTANGILEDGDSGFALPVYVETVAGKIWEEDKLLNRIRKVYLKANLEEDVIIGGSDAETHREGDGPVGPEALQTATVKVIAEMVKKTIYITDELYSMKGQAFVDYLFDEFRGKIRQLLQQKVLQAILTAATENKMGVANLVRGTATPDATDYKNDVLTAWTRLSDEAENPIVVMSKATYAKYRALRATTGQRLDDVFEGLEVVIVNSLDTLVGKGDPIIVGDFKGIIGNYPVGEEVQFIFDNITLADEDKVKITGKCYAGYGIDRYAHFALLHSSN